MKTLLSLMLLALLPAPAFAVDGVVLINQSIALAGGVTPGDGPGFPVTISVPGSYQLSGNLIVPDANTTAIQITSDNVSIDLNGFSILGPSVCGPVSCSPTGTGNGIDGGAHLNISLSNGIVRGMGFAGIFSAGFYIRVEKIQAYSNAFGGILAGNGYALVSDCIVSQNGQGINATNSTVKNNIATGNLKDGISGSGTILNNTATFNGFNGIDVFNALVSGNTVQQNSQAGIAAGCPSNIVANFATGNSGGDIFTIGSGCARFNNLPLP